MKQLRKEKGKMVAYVQKDDLVSLLQMPKFVSKDLEEEIISLLSYDGIGENGDICKIENPELIKEIYSYPFILDYNKMKGFSLGQLDTLRQRAMNGKATLDLILRIKYTPGFNITKRHQEFLDNYQGIDLAMVDGKNDVDIEDKINCVDTQLKNYTQNLKRLYYIKQAKQLQEIRDEHSNLQIEGYTKSPVKRFVKRIKGSVNARTNHR